ncbi:MAG: histidine phosphatase family protein [Lachnospiraceae bacterium]|nr:histidine phosphatase family protein [Lachnospiraceae bacterium]
MKLYMIRHGETDWNKERRLQGQADIPLNEFGKTLACKTAEGLKNVIFDMAYTSPLIRAKQTADIVLGDRKIPIIEEPRIQEIGFGIFEGLCCSEEGWNIPDHEFENFFHTPEKYKAPQNGESFEAVIKRVSKFLEELFGNEKYKDKTILISTHGASLRAMLDYIRNIPLEKFWDGGVHKNCAVTIVNYLNGRPEVEKEGIIYYDDIVKEW